VNEEEWSLVIIINISVAPKLVPPLHRKLKVFTIQFKCSDVYGGHYKNNTPFPSPGRASVSHAYCQQCYDRAADKVTLIWD